MNTNPTGSSGAEDQRQDNWEATFFNPDGTSVTKSGQTAPPAAKEEAPAKDRSELDPAAAVQEHMEDLGDALHEKFMGLLTSKVLETGGQLTIDDVAEMGEEFRSQMKEIETIFLDAVESYTLAREKNRVDQSRGNLFTRLMVKKFEHRFADEETLQHQPELLSRRMLPGYMNMIQVMFGDARVASYEAKAKALIDKMREDAGGRLDWNDVYKSAEARKLTLLAEVDIARRFDDVEKRFDWMIALIEANTIPADEDFPGTPWHFNKSAAEWMMTSLLGDLSNAIRKPKTRATISGRVGEDVLITLDDVVRRFS